MSSLEDLLLSILNLSDLYLGVAISIHIRIHSDDSISR